MKRFKQFLVEETITSAQIVGDTQPVTAPSTKAPTYTPPTKPTRPSAVKRREGDEEEQDNQDTAPPTFDEWIEQNPIPRREDYQEDWDFQQEMDAWKQKYLEWLYRYRQWQHEQNPLPDDMPSGEWDIQLDDRMRDLDDIARETYGAPIDPNRDRTPDGLPPGWKKDDYYYWKKEYERFYGRPLSGNESEFYDWLWRLFRQGQTTPGTVPHVYSTDPNDPWVEPPLR